jgi:flagellar protein FliS
MFGAKAYAQVGLESGVIGASPHGLILMLFDGAIQSITHAQIHMKNNSIEEKGAAISKAIRIIDEGLKAALDVKSGGELAEQLWLLYDFISRELIMASAHNNSDKMKDCIDLLQDLRSAWSEIGQTTPAKEAYTA